MSLENLNSVFKNLNLDAKCVNWHTTASSAFYDVELGNNITIERFSSLDKELQFRIKSANPLFIKVLPESGIVRIQDLKKNQQKLNFEDVSSSFSSENVSVVLGKDYEENVLVTDFSQHPHTLIAGTTGSGKSNALHNIICNALMNKTTELFLSDSKGVEFLPYHDLRKVKMISQSYEENVIMLSRIADLMESRFRLMKNLKVNNYKRIVGMNPALVVLDEISDLILQDNKNTFKNLLLKICQKSRAAGIFIVAATQRPSVDVLSGVIKANFPARIALKTASATDSKVILDEPGSESLQGSGDAIIKNHQYSSVRFRFPFIDPNKIIRNL